MILEDRCDGSYSGLDTFIDKFPTTKEINKELDLALKDTHSERLGRYSKNFYFFVERIYYNLKKN